MGDALERATRQFVSISRGEPEAGDFGPFIDAHADGDAEAGADAEADAEAEAEAEAGSGAVRCDAPRPTAAHADGDVRSGTSSGSGDDAADGAPTGDPRAEDAGFPSDVASGQVWGLCLRSLWQWLQCGRDRWAAMAANAAAHVCALGCSRVYARLLRAATDPSTIAPPK